LLACKTGVTPLIVKLVDLPHPTTMDHHWTLNGAASFETLPPSVGQRIVPTRQTMSGDDKPSDFMLELE
jgi:hypothetical protein